MMSTINECRYCTYRGDISKCKSVACIRRESWYAIEQQKKIDILRKMMWDFVRGKTDKSEMVEYFQDGA